MSTPDPSLSAARAAVYGAPPPDLATVDEDAVQVSPLFPDAPASLEMLGEGGLRSITLLAPPGTVERRYALALSLRALAPGGVLTATAPKDKGGARLRKELETFGGVVSETARRHHRICICPAAADPAGLEEAIVQGRPRFVEAIGLWSQPGVFSWDRIDPGSALLAARAPALGGRCADLGCGIGFLARRVLASPTVERLVLVDNDRRAVEAAQRNIDDGRARFFWADVNAPGPEAEAELAGLDAVIMNPPFHGGGGEDRALGLSFIRRAGQMLRPGGVCWLVANRHLPYEAALGAVFSKVRVEIEQGGYKVFEARR